MDFLSEVFDEEELVPKFWGKGFNLNVVNFGEDNIIFDNNYELPTSLVSNIIDSNDDLTVHISFLRLSYDDESNQEFYLDLFNLDSTHQSISNNLTRKQSNNQQS